MSAQPLFVGAREDAAPPRSLIESEDVHVLLEGLVVGGAWVWLRGWLWFSLVVNDRYLLFSFFFLFDF